ncbi:AAA family ATPase [uncultured Corynebacterium sp.]|uniref:AAA family ATPase n=1 Tax=uncultured Corynebacterium sp. TaxID=159447 RepID=UPI0025988DEC|nr:AAA family ATPase [uncultured Corynebacterium sp.]
MRIHDLIIDNVRAIEHLELRDLPATGVILIHGENEAGKSTILDAIDAVLHFKHTAGGKDVRVLEPAGRDAGPEVTLTATVGPYTFTIHKRFKRRKLSELSISAPRREQYTGREADDKLEAILGEHLDRDLAATLFLRQGAAEPGIAAAGIPSVTRALDAGAQDVPSGSEDTELMERIREEYGRYFTAQGKKKASFTALENAAGAARALAEGKREELQRLSGAVDEVEARTTEITEIDAELPQAQEEHSRREQEAAAAREVQAAADAAREATQRAAVDLERAEADLAARAAARERLEGLRAEAGELAALLEPAAEKAREEREAVSALTGARDAAREALHVARENAKTARAGLEAARRRRRLAELEELSAKLDAADAELARLLEALPERPVTGDDVRRIEESANEVALQRKLADATSAKLDITPDTATTITVDGDTRALDGTTSVTVAEGTELRLGAFDVVYRAGAGAGASDGAGALEEAERDLAEALAAAGCDSAEEARARRDEHARLAADADAARARRAELTQGRDAQEMRAELARLRDAVDPADSSAPGVGEAEAASAAAERAVDEATEDAERADAALRPWEERKAGTELSVLEARKEAKDSEVAAASNELESAEATTPLAALEAAREKTSGVLKRLAADCDALAAEVAAANPALAADLLDGAAARLDNLRQRRTQAENRVLELGGRIEMATGIAEQADRADAALEAAEHELARTTRRAEAARLLWETMNVHRDAARARYAEPFARALNRYAAVVFGPDVEFTLGDDLQVQARTVGGTTVALDQLSGGAKEQLAILTRFAIAELAGRGGEGEVPVPVMVDDALGATDPERLVLMNSLFTNVARDAQVFVLTCFPQRFDRVVAARRASISELKG